MNQQSKDFATMLRRAAQATAEASVVKPPVIRKKPSKDAIYGVAEPKKKVNVQNKVLSDREKQAIWNRNMKPVPKKIPMLSKTATALAQMQQRSQSPQPLPPIPAVPYGRPQMQVQGILSTAPQAQSTPMWRIK